MSTTWNEMALSEFVTLQRGHDLPATQRRLGTVPVMGSFGLTGYHDEAKALGPGVTVGRSGASFGVVSFSERDYWPLNTALYVNNFNGNDPRFAYYFLKSIDFTAFNSGSAQPSLNRNFINPIRVRVPEIGEQRRIADILGSLDDKIELNRRTNQTLEAIVRRLFRSWFVDFDPVRAKAALRRKHPKWDNPRLSRQALPNLDPAIAELFPDELVDSELGEAPKRWRVGTIGDVVVLDKTLVKPMAYPDELFSHYSIPAHDDGKRPVTELGEGIKSSKFVVTDDCVLLTKLNPRIPRVWLPFPGTRCRSICSTEFLVLKPSPGILREYAYSLVSSEAFFETYTTMVTGTSGSHQRIRPEHLLAMKAVVPPLGIVEAFCAQAIDSFDRQHRLRIESIALEETRDKLLPRLLSGELEVRNDI